MAITYLIELIIFFKFNIEQNKKRKSDTDGKSSKKKSGDDKKVQGFDRGLDPERILGIYFIFYYFHIF